MVELASDHPRLVKRRFFPRAADVRRLLESVSEAERVDAEALPPAGLVAHAVAAIAERAPAFKLERVVVSARGFAHAELPTRLAGLVVRANAGRARARVRVSQNAGPVLEVDAHGSWALVEAEPRGEVPADLVEFSEALHGGEARYAHARTWPTEFVVALAAAGVEAEEQDGLAKLLRLTVDLVSEAPLRERLHFAIDGVKPIAGDMARVVFRVVAGRSRLVARGDAIIVSALPRSAAMTLRRVA